MASRGVSGTLATAFTSAGESSCGYAFKQGERYVVYARRSRNTSQILVTTCSRTRPLSRASEDMIFFDRLSAPPTGARVFGTIVHRETDLATAELREYGPVANVTVRLRRSNQSFEARTGRDGRYVLTGLPTGSYDVMAELPAGFLGQLPTRKLELPDPRACFRADAVVRYDSRVIGSVSDANGNPLDVATVEAVPMPPSGTWRYGPGPQSRIDAAGNFELPIPPGQYLIAVNIAERPQSEIVTVTAYHPGTFDPARATVIDLRGAERRQLERMLMPPLPRAYRVTGIVTLPDGSPAAGASIMLSDANAIWRDLASPVQADANGRFSLPVYEGLRYVVSAGYRDPRAPDRTSATGSAEFTASADTTKTVELKLTLRR
jgi:hypothetical protein